MARGSRARKRRERKKKRDIPSPAKMLQNTLYQKAPSKAMACLAVVSIVALVLAAWITLIAARRYVLAGSWHISIRLR